MKTVICWYSVSGNSFAVAKRLAEKIQNAELVRITGETVVPAAARVGIIFPVHAFGAPSAVKRFVRALTAKDVFAVATCSVTAGAALKGIRQVLRLNDISPAAEYGVKMPMRGLSDFNKTGAAPALPEGAMKRVDEIAGELNRL